MARPLRIEFAGALYHATSRGNRREPIYEDDEDRQLFLATLGEVTGRMNWICHGYCLMTNHYHLIIETPEGNLAKGMRQLNGVYTQASNRRHGRVGHLFQGRYYAVLVDSGAYLLELARYVVLNPVRAGMVDQPDAWPWSSYKAMVGAAEIPEWLATEGLLTQFNERQVDAQRQLKKFVAEGIGKPSIWAALKGQIYLGDEEFVRRAQARLGGASEDVNVPQVQRRPPPLSLADIERQSSSRDGAIVAAYASGAYSYQALAAHFGIHFTTVGRIVRSARNNCIK
jgi:REP element-mobilizing transposase RayT